MSSPWIVAPTLTVWAIAAVPLLGPLWSLLTRPTLAATEALLTHPGAVTAFWAQIIAWDLFIGRCIADIAGEKAHNSFDANRLIKQIGS